MLPPSDVVACGANPTTDYCWACIDAYRDGIEPGGSACDEHARKEDFDASAIEADPMAAQRKGA